MSIPSSDYSVASILGLGPGAENLGPYVPDAAVPRRRRSRTVYSREAIDKMEALFQETQYPDIHQRERLSAEVGVPEARIQVWFQNRRSRSSVKRGVKVSGKRSKRASSDSDESSGPPADLSDEQTEPPTKMPRNITEDVEDDKASTAKSQPTEKFPYYYLPPYYTNYFCKPYFFNPALGHPHYALLTANYQNPPPLIPFASNFFNIPTMSAASALPSPIPHLSVSPPALSSNELSQTAGVPQGYTLSPTLFSGDCTSPKDSNTKVQMHVPPLNHVTRNSITELSSAYGRVEAIDNGNDDDSQDSRLPSPAFSFRTESSLSLDSFGASDSGFGHELFSDSW